VGRDARSRAEERARSASRARRGATGRSSSSLSGLFLGRGDQATGARTQGKVLSTSDRTLSSWLRRKVGSKRPVCVAHSTVHRCAASHALEFSPLLCGQSDPRRTWARHNCWMQRLTMDSISPNTAPERGDGRHEERRRNRHDPSGCVLSSRRGRRARPPPPCRHNISRARIRPNTPDPGTNFGRVVLARKAEPRRSARAPPTAPLPRCPPPNSRPASAPLRLRAGIGVRCRALSCP
jgi:hypothetical protein